MGRPASKVLVPHTPVSDGLEVRTVTRKPSIGITESTSVMQRSQSLRSQSGLYSSASRLEDSNEEDRIHHDEDEEEESGPEKWLPSVWVRLPNTAFGIAMGLAGQSILWKASERILPNVDTFAVNSFFWVWSLVAFAIISTAYLYKVIFSFALVKDEYADGIRVHFFNMPHLIMIMLTLGTPPKLVLGEEAFIITRRVIWAIGFVAQVIITFNIYERWLFSVGKGNISCARPQFLLSTVGWFLLANLGAISDIEDKWGLPLPSFCFGVGMIFYLMVAIAIFNGIHVAPDAKGSPALFLLIAPPSVGVVGIDNITQGDELAVASEVLYGWVLGVLLLLIKVGPKILQHPPSFGAYWAYVFPLAALATASIQVAWRQGSRSAQAMAVVFIVVSTTATFVVFSREAYHSIMVMRGKGEWKDGLLTKAKVEQSVRSYVYSETFNMVETA